MNKEHFNAFIYYAAVDCALSKNTLAAYQNDLADYADYLAKQGISELSAVTSDDIRRYLHFCEQNNLSSKTIERRASTIRVFHRYLFTERKLPADPASFIEAPKLGKYLPSVLSDDEMTRLLSSVTETGTRYPQRDTMIVELLYGCGLRVSELSDLRIGRIKLNTGVIRVLGKGSKERVVPLGEKAAIAVKSYIEGEYTHLRNELSKDYVLLSRYGNRLDRHAIFKIIQKLAALSGVKKAVSPHTLRHSFATELLKGGADLRGVQELLGHANIATTEIYTHIDKKRLKESHRKFHPRG